MKQWYVFTFPTTFGDIKQPTTHQDFLLRLPGVTVDNVRLITDKVDTLAQLANTPATTLRQLIGQVNGSQLYEFLHQSY